MLKKISYSILGLFLLLLTIIALISSHLGVSIALNYAQSNGFIEYENFEGSLYSKLNFERLSIDNESIDVQLQNVSIDIGLTCLLDIEVCVNSLSVSDSQVFILSSDTPPETSEQITDYVKIPVDIEVLSVDLSNIVLNLGASEVTLSELAINGVEVEESTVDINSVSLNSVLLKTLATENQNTATDPKASNNNDNSTDAANSRVTTGDLESQIQNVFAQLQTAPTVSLPDIFIPINVTLDSLSLGLFSTANTADSEAQTQSLISDLKLTASLIEQVVHVDLSSDIDALNSSPNLSLLGNVDLRNALTHQLELELIDSTNGMMLNADIDGDLSQQKLDVLVNEQKVLDIDATSDIRAAELPLDVALVATNMASLYQALETFTAKSPFEFKASNMPVLLSEGNMRASGDWQTGFDSELDILLQHAPIGDADTDDAKIPQSTVKGGLSFSPTQANLDLDDLLIAGDVGRLSLSGNMQASQSSPLIVNNRLALSTENFNVEKFVPSVDAVLSGGFTLEHKYTQNTNDLRLECSQIKGTYLQRPLAVSCDITLAPDGSVDISSLQATLGDNEVQLTGTSKLPSSQLIDLTAATIMSLPISAYGDITLRDLSQIDSSFDGSALSSFELSGPIDSLKVDASASATSLRLQDLLQIETLSFTASVDSSQNWLSDIQLTVSNAQVQDLAIESVELNASGNKEEHSLALDAKSQELSVSTVLDGGLDANFVWRGSWQKADIQHALESLTMRQPTEILVDIENQRYRLNQHCWNSSTQTDVLCVDTTAFADDKVNVGADINFDVSKLLTKWRSDLFLPETKIQIASNVDGQFSLSTGADIRVSNLITGQLQTTQHRIQLSAIVANVDIQGSKLASHVYAGSQQTGVIGLISQLDLATEDKVHNGQLVVQSLKLSTLRRFLDGVNQLEGQVDAAMSFKGSLVNPLISGQLDVSNGELLLDSYTYPLTEFEQTAVFTNTQVDLKGRFKLGNGPATYQASIDYSEALEVNGEIIGEGIEFAYDKHLAKVSPDIEFSLTPNLLSASGNVVVDESFVKIEALPESARSPSSDLIIVGEPPEPPIIPIGIDVDISVLVDPDELKTVNIEALGLEASLGGDLRIQVVQRQSMDKQSYQPMRTLVNGYVTVLEGKYQAYGQKLQIRRGTINFNGDPSLPQFDLSAIRDPLYTEGDVVAGIRVTGNPVLPKVELFSEPPMIQARQLSYLLQGKDLGGGGESNYDTDLLAALVNFGVGRSENRVSEIGKAFGLDSLSLQTAGQGEQTQLQVTGRLAKNLQITYGVGVFESASEVILKYQIMPKLYIEARNSTISSIDLFYEVASGKITD